MNQIDRISAMASRPGNVDLIEDAVNDVWSAWDELRRGQSGQAGVHDDATLAAAVDRVYAARDTIEDAIADLPAKRVSRRGCARRAGEPGGKRAAAPVAASLEIEA